MPLIKGRRRPARSGRAALSGRPRLSGGPRCEAGAVAQAGVVRRRDARRAGSRQQRQDAGHKGEQPPPDYHRPSLRSACTTRAVAAPAERPRGRAPASRNPGGSSRSITRSRAVDGLHDSGDSARQTHACTYTECLHVLRSPGRCASICGTARLGPVVLAAPQIPGLTAMHQSTSRRHRALLHTHRRRTCHDAHVPRP